MASEDADEVGLRAEHVLADGGTALALLGGEDASPAARAAVVQRFGRVGALLVLGYEERGRAQHLGPLNPLPNASPNGSHNGSPNGSHNGSRSGAVNGSHNGSSNASPNGSHNGHREAEQLDDGKGHIERLVRDFADLDALGLYRLLGEIDHDEGLGGDGDGVDAHRWLHATYAVAARDGTPGAHRAYMRALDRVMRLVRPLVAS
ncbi:MAG TPA: hypothetical protein VK215_15090 [Acidimicrobiales bacterium]|nr:hypothetical protein [Acidimicrobiales bacterium]